MNQKQNNAVRDKDRGLFAAANSGHGFVSFYDCVFDRPELKRRYLIKGGPGTGKSSFMRKIARASEEQGRHVRYYDCSSDPDSLDGIVIDDRIAVLDSTAPHAMEPRIPGARDEIINLGLFWASDALARRYNEIEALDREKSGAYAGAYRYLAAATELFERNRELIRPYVLEKKMQTAAHRLLVSKPRGERFDLLPGLQRAIGMRGRVRLDTYEHMAGALYKIEDFYDIGSLFLERLIREAREKRLPICVSYDPLLPDRPDGVLFRGDGDCFLCGVGENTEPEGRIRMRRFVDAQIPPEIKAEIRLNRRTSEALVSEAEHALLKAGRAHGQLEEIFGSCMNFEQLDQFTEEFIRSLN